MNNTEKIYKGLRSHYGAMKTLAERRGVSERWVTLVLKGASQDEDLVLEAAKLWRELEEQKAAKLAEASQIAESAAAIQLSMA